MAAKMLLRTRRRASRSHRSLLIDSLEDRRLLSATYFVATWGTDQGPGTSNQPFRTIQEAANVANSGDTVDIFGGTYRETVKPAHSGVTFTSYGGQTVVVSGSNVVSGWTQYSGSIYTTSMPVDLGEGNNQVFVDGNMVSEATWPNAGPNISTPTEATIGSYSNNTIYDQAITQGNGYWTGATIHVTPGSSWVGYTGMVTNSGPGWLQVSLPSLSGYEVPTAGNQFYLSGKFQALTAPGQWYAANGTLYLWDPASDNPAGHTVEIKERQYAFNLSGIANTTIKGINIFAATIYSDWGSTNTTINGINAEYLSQFNNIWNSGWSPPTNSGIALNGTGSILENSTIAFSAGDGVFIGNSNIRVTNNVIHDVDYSGTDAAGVRDYGANTEIDNNTIYNTGRDGINFQAAGVTVLSNTVHNAMLQTNDGGGIYTVNNTGGGTIAHNTIYNVVALYNVNAGQFGVTGIFLDNNSANFSVYDNITANVDSGIRMNFSSVNEQIYGNELGGIYYAIDGNGGNWSGTQIYNNTLYNPNLLLGGGASVWNNPVSGGSPGLPSPTTTFTASPPPPPAVVVSPPPPVVSPPPAPTSASRSTSTTPVAASGSSSTQTGTASAPASSIPSTAPTVTSAAKATPAALPLVGPKMPASKKTAATVKKTKSPKTTTSTATVTAPKTTTTAKPAAATTVAVPLDGSIAGTYRVKTKLGKAPGGYALTGKGTLSNLKISSAVAQSLGALKMGKATGMLTLVTATGSLQLALTAPEPASATAIATAYSFVITSGTGSYKSATGQGNVTLTVTPSKKNGKPGTFTLAFKSS